MTKHTLVITLCVFLTSHVYADKEDTQALCKKAESPLFATDTKDQIRRFSLEHSTRIASITGEL